MFGKLNKNKLFRLTLAQSVTVSFALVLVAVLASVFWIWKVEQKRQEQVAAAQVQLMARQFSRQVDLWSAQLGREAAAVNDVRAGLASMAQRLAAQPLLLLTPNGDVLAESIPNSAAAIAPMGLAMLTTKAMEYGRSSGLLGPEMSTTRSASYAVASKLRDPANPNEVTVLVAVFPLNTATVNEAINLSGRRVSALAVRPGNASLGSSEFALLKTASGDLVGLSPSETPVDSDLWLLVAPGLAIGFVSTLLAGAFLVSAARRQNERLALLRRVADSHADGKSVKLTPSGQKDSVSRLAMSLRRMIDVSNEREHRLLKLAYRDAETDLPNRILYQERIATMLEEVNAGDQSFSILALRVDGLNTALEVVSPESRIRLLKDLSTRLLRCVRRTDESPDPLPGQRENATVARLDDDVFGILLPKTDVHQAQGLAAALIQNVTHQFALDERKILLSPYVGVASYPSHGVAGMVLHRAALSALADAQRGGQNLHLFGQAVKPLTQKRDAQPKVALHRDEFDFDWDKIAH